MNRLSASHRLPSRSASISAAAPAPDHAEPAEPSSPDKALFQRPGAAVPATRGRSLSRLPLELAQYFCALVAAHHLQDDRCVRAAADVLSRRISRRQVAERERDIRQYRVRRTRRYEQRG